MSDELTEVSGIPIPGQVVEKIRRLIAVRAEIEELEAELKEKSAEERNLSGVEVPDLFFENELSMIKWRGGASIEIKKDIKASVPKDPEKQEQVLYFLKKYGAMDLVKTEAVIEKPTSDIIELFRNNRVPFLLNKSVATVSFQALLRDLLGLKAKSIQRITVSDIPEAANPFMYYETKIK